MSGTSNSKITIFISYKHKHGGEIARAIREKFSVFGSNRLEFKIDEDIPPGDDWRKWIKESIREANIMFFLRTRLDKEWDWCLYEAGLFEGLKGKDNKRLIVFYSPSSKPPSPLENLQAVEATRTKVRDFLKRFFGSSDLTEADPPINLPFAYNEQLLDSTAEEICRLMNCEPDLG